MLVSLLLDLFSVAMQRVASFVLLPCNLYLHTLFSSLLKYLLLVCTYMLDSRNEKMITTHESVSCSNIFRRINMMLSAGSAHLEKKICAPGFAAFVLRETEREKKLWLAKPCWQRSLLFAYASSIPDPISYTLLECLHIGLRDWLAYPMVCSHV